MNDLDQTPPAPPPGQQLTGWLCGLVRARQYGQLADLRRPTALTEARLTAANLAPSEDTRDVFERVAFLFARYHAGRLEPSPDSETPAQPCAGSAPAQAAAPQTQALYGYWTASSPPATSPGATSNT